MENELPRLPDGFYTATVSDWRYRELGPENKPCVKIRFKVKMDQGPDQFADYTGWLTTVGAKKVTMKALLVCGFRDQNLERFCGGREAAALDTNREVSIEVIHETNPRNGKEYAKVRWVNPTGLGAGSGVTEKLKSIDLGEAMAEAHKELGGHVQPAAGCKAEETADDIGF
jgi:hypothetical protein